MTPYRFEFLESADREFSHLPARLQRLFAEKLVYLLRNPFRSYPWLRVRQGARHPGEWRFHLGEYRVFYRVEGTVVVFTRIARTPRAYPRGVPKRRTRVQSDGRLAGVQPAGPRAPHGKGSPHARVEKWEHGVSTNYFGTLA